MLNPSAVLAQGPVWLPAINKLFFVSNRLGDVDATDQYVELWTLDPETLETSQVEPRMPILMGNGATNWSPSEVLVLAQVGCIYPSRSAGCQPTLTKPMVYSSQRCQSYWVACGMLIILCVCQHATHERHMFTHVQVNLAERNLVWS